jgi:hypothetical protein
MLGIAFNGVLFYGALALRNVTGSVSNFDSPLFCWHNAPAALVNALFIVLPGFVAGLSAVRRPFVVGCIVGAVSCAVQVIIISIAWGPLPAAQLVPTLVVGSVVGAIAQGISALGGAYVRQAAAN